MEKLAQIIEKYFHDHEDLGIVKYEVYPERIIFIHKRNDRIVEIAGILTSNVQMFGIFKYYEASLKKIVREYKINQIRYEN